MPLTPDGIHMLRVATLRLIEELSSPAGEGMDEEQVRQVRAMVSALMAALPSQGRPAPVTPSGVLPPGATPEAAMARRGPGRTP